MMYAVNNKVKTIVSVLCIIIVSLLSFYLFYHQLYFSNSGFKSDLPTHINNSISHTSYSLMGLIFKASYAMFRTKIACIAVLAALVCLGILLSAFLLCQLLEFMNVEIRYSTAMLICTPLTFICNIYIPNLYENFYLYSAYTQPWHNSTSILLRLFGLISIYFFFKIEKDYLDKISLKDWILFTLSLTLTNYSKPNFIIAFAPIMLMLLIYDFLRLKGRGTLQMIKFGVCVLCSMPILIWQYSLLYDNSSPESNVSFSFRYLVEYFSEISIFWYFVCGMLFPILATIICALKKYNNKYLVLTWGFYALSWLEARLLVETGVRQGHGNYGWGRYFFGYLLTIVCISIYIKMFKEKIISKKALVICVLPLCISIVCGIWYFGKLLTGENYLI